ncbi:MAG TPA: GatB/YqeY domain-containing protein, partial [Actinomycetota bacterium]|nr:GatB/YqeY domain-containing protein [Actinomycetota bacterium]
MPEPGGSLKERLAEELKEAMRARDEVRLSALRLLATAVRNREVELRRELSDLEVGEVALREAKRRTEAIEAYERAGRADLAARERGQADALRPYLPAMLSDAEVDRLIDDALAATGASGPGDLGKVMGFVMGRARGKVDGAEVQRRVRARLG